MLKDLVFPPTFIKSRNEIYDEFYKPCMENSSRYDRITGFFGSSIFIVINRSLIKFIENKGKIRIICSPILSDEDIDAINKGYFEKIGSKSIDLINEIIDELLREHPNATLVTSKLITTGILEIRLAVLGENIGDNRLMHDKAGVFRDNSGDAVGFRGSINETFKGVSSSGNTESFDVFTSWEDGKDKERVRIVINQFEEMWEGKEKGIKIFSFPDDSIAKMRDMKCDKSIQELISEIIPDNALNTCNWFAEIGPNARKAKSHQVEILDNWEKKNRKGLFKMCTGSGKTFTALCAMRDAIFNRSEIPIVVVPSKLLLEQWKKEIDNTFNGEVHVLTVGGKYRFDASKVRRITNPRHNIKRCILTTYHSLSKIAFIEAANWGKHILLICDEVHNIGSDSFSKILNVDCGPRIGLSATPERYFDESSTDRIFKFFGQVIHPVYEISDAIRDDILCRYFYEINEVCLTDEEQCNWNKLTMRINKLIASKKTSDISIKDIQGLNHLLFKRSDIIKKSIRKIDVASQIILSEFVLGQKWLVYLDDSEQLNELKNVLLRVDKFRGQVLEYHTNSESNLSQTLLHYKSSGGVLLSINCLDEGIDIPEIERAIIVASSKNPRQYIQRRGRVLRKSKGKSFAYIYDCIVLPSGLYEDGKTNMSIVKSEIARARSFSLNSESRFIVEKRLDIIMSNYNIDIEEGNYGTED